MPGFRVAVAAVVTTLALAGAANAQTYPNAQVRLIVPTSPGGVTDTMARIVGTPPPPNGTRFCVIDFPPGNHPHMHRTETVDYVIVIDGEIEMDMDDSTVKLKAGDILVQRGTNHAWANRSGKNARVAFVLVDGKPLGIGKPVLGPNSPP